MSVALVLCLMMILRILYFTLTLRIVLSLARWVVSSFFTNAFVRDHFWHPYVIAGETKWLKTFLYRLMGRCLSRKISLYFPNTLYCYCLSQIFIISHLLYFCPVYLHVVCYVNICSKFVFFLYVSLDKSLSFLHSMRLSDAPYLSHLLLSGLHYQQILGPTFFSINIYSFLP